MITPVGDLGVTHVYTRQYNFFLPNEYCESLPGQHDVNYLFAYVLPGMSANGPGTAQSYLKYQYFI